MSLALIAMPLTRITYTTNYAQLVILKKPSGVLGIQKLTWKRFLLRLYVLLLRKSQNGFILNRHLALNIYSQYPKKVNKTFERNFRRLYTL